MRPIIYLSKFYFINLIIPKNQLYNKGNQITKRKLSQKLLL